ncbi:enoyl-CoA hydratase-related protein [Halopseudomonas pachastrellae]|nr:enoyl-CoA hydratase-related protein [Halopseudomonas pachastrellae]
MTPSTATKRQDQPEGDDLRDGGGTVSLRIYECTKPVIVAFNGAAVGVGVTMSLPADIRMASNQRQVRLCVWPAAASPGSCSSWFLPRLVGPMQAAEWVYTPAVFSAPKKR